MGYGPHAMAIFDDPQPGRPYVLAQAESSETLDRIETGLIDRLFRAHGAILFRGFAMDVDRFDLFARRFCATSVINESPGRAPIAPDAGILSVDGGTNAFPLHPELSREPWKPDVAMFACFRAPRSGGATTICDGVALVRQMPAHVREGLANRRLVHVQGTWPALLRFWLGTDQPSDALLDDLPDTCPYRFARTPGGIARIFSRPALHKPLFTDDAAFGNFLLFARFNNGRPDFPVLDDGQPVPEDWLQAIKATGDRLSCAIDWRDGDLLMLDNSRFMHGRTAIIDTAERHIATFFGYLRNAPANPEEPPRPIWRESDFRPPAPPAWAGMAQAR